MSIDLEKLNPKQKAAVECAAGPLLIMAGAGSGKTRVLTTKIAHLLEQGVAPYRILAITFTNKAAAEMRSRINNMIGQRQAAALWVHTFHAFCARFLRMEIENIPGYKSNFAIYDAGDSFTLIKHCLKELNLDDKKFTPSMVASHISKAKNALQDAGRFEMRANGFMEEKIAQIYTLYENKLLANNALDFDDLLLVTVRALSVNTELLNKWQQHFEYILVDEYQDTNKAQYLLTRMLAQKHQNICVVGDADQSIYAWRGADMQNILDFERDYPQAKVVLLEENYRSTQNILNAANAVIANNTNRKEKRLWTSNDQGKPLNYYRAADEYTEANYIAGKIKEAVNDGQKNYRDFAVLYRLNAQSRLFEETLLKHSIPYIMVGGLKFYDRKEIKDILAYLRVIYNPQDDLGLQRIINVPRRGIGETTLAKIAEYAEYNSMSLAEAVGHATEIPGLTAKFAVKILSFANQLQELQQVYAEHKNVEMLINAILTKTGYMVELQADGSEKAQERIENIYELVNLSKDVAQEGSEHPLEDFLEHVALVSDLDQTENKTDAVTLMTLHAAKGLEFDTVFLAAMEEGIFPHSRAFNDDRELEEERRLCYVGITRAQKELYLSNAATRMVYGNFVGNPESRFIAEIPPALLLRHVPKVTVKENSDSPWSGYKKPINAAPTFVKQKPAAAVSSKNAEIFKIGDNVKHRVWGVGKIIMLAPKNSYQELTIQFPEVGEKKVISTGGFVTKVDIG